ncbi:MAG TPA: hypothetical protein PKX07_14715, partial [Aggregatilineales bacterium]|nr:hypothetical protein [Aggregatilineales bacterium]
MTTEAHQKRGLRLLSASALLLIAALIAVVVLMLVVSPPPVERTLDYDGAQVTLTADRQWVTFPGDCVNVTWTVSGAASTTFYPVIEPGILWGPGTRSVFFQRNYRPGPSIHEDALGGIDETLDPDGPAVTRSESACIDYTSEPKLRVHFTDGTSQALKLGIDTLFLRFEPWLMLGAVLTLAWGAVLLLFPRLTLRPVRLALWTSALLMLFYAWVFVDHGAFFAVYPLDGLIFTALAGGVLAFSVLSLWRPARFDAVAHRIALRLRTSPRFTVWLGVLILWGWALAFAYVDRRAPLISEWLWLPFLLWAALIGFAVLWFTRPPRDAVLRSARWSVRLALAFAVAVIIRDLYLLDVFGLRLMNDTVEYINDGRDLFNPAASSGLPKRMLPYLLLNHVTRTWESPDHLIALQIALGALAVAVLVYVLARRRLWLGLAAGLLLTLDLTWATYNRTMLTEGPFISFHVLMLAVVLWQYDRRQRLRAWELVAAGVLFGWTLLFRGTGLPLIPVLLVVYALMTRALRPALLVALGIGLFLAGVLSHSQWRYGETGLVGPQHDTLVSALYSYHLFSPENGPESAILHSSLRECMGYLDYDDVPRYQSRFIYNHFNHCLVVDENYNYIPELHNEITQRVSKALRELILSRPFDYARVLLVEMGKGVAFDATTAVTSNVVSSRDVICTQWYDAVFCGTTASYEGDPQTANTLSAVTTALGVPTRLHQSASWISSATDAVYLAAFVMMCGFALIAGRQQLIVVLLVGFIGYQILVSAAVHVLLARYIDVLSPFFIVLSVMAVGTLFEQIRGFRPRLWMLLVALPMILYVSYANPTLRHRVGAPLSAHLGINLLQKFGVDDADFALYRVLEPAGGRAYFPGAGEREILFDFGRVLQPYD